jgi:hypothetical protein
MVLRLTSRSPRRSGSFVTVVSGYGFVRARSGRLASVKLDAGVEASEPHDFTVRNRHLSSARRSTAHGPYQPALPSRRAPNAAASTASRPTLVTCATPLSWDGTARISELIWVRREQKYFCKGGWTGKLPNTTDLPVRQRLIRFNKLPFCFSGFLVRMP